MGKDHVDVHYERKQGNVCTGFCASKHHYLNKQIPNISEYSELARMISSNEF